MNGEDWQRYHAANRAPWVPCDALFAQEVASLAPGRALEVACGEGSDALHLARLGFDVLAVDLAQAAVQITAQRAVDAGLRLRTVKANAVTLSLQERFDLIYMGFLDLPDRERAEALSALVTHLVPGGIFLYIGFEETGQPDEISVLLAPLTIERCEIVRREISMPNQEDFEADCVVIRARRGEQ
jgi:2-polyprenyl-3-methyl-5-hydroxy-6-metoxy-1,4-benzoquinol methylase